MRSAPAKVTWPSRCARSTSTTWNPTATDEPVRCQASVPAGLRRRVAGHDAYLVVPGAPGLGQGRVRRADQLGERPPELIHRGDPDRYGHPEHEAGVAAVLDGDRLPGASPNGCAITSPGLGR